MLKPSSPFLVAVQQGHEKRDPVLDRRASLPASVVDGLSKPLALVASYMLPILTDTRNLTETQVLPDGTKSRPGETWLAFLTACQAAYAANKERQGLSWTEEDLDKEKNPEFARFYDRMCWQIREKGGIPGVCDKLRLVCQGAQGTVWRIESSVLDWDTWGEEMVDPLMLADERSWEDMPFPVHTHSEISTGLTDRGRPHDQLEWVQVVARTGAEGERFTNTGAFEPTRNQKGRLVWLVDEQTPCTFPWVRLDVDGEDLVESYESVNRILETLGGLDCDMNEITAVYTGGKGFHVWIPSGMLGNRAFSSVKLARQSLERWVSEVLDEPVDPALYDPRQLIRLPGSQRGRLYVTAFPASEFCALSLEEVVEASRTFRPFEFKDPRSVERHEELAAIFRRVSLCTFWVPAFEDVRTDIRFGGSGAVKRALEGVEESEAWHDKHWGRSKAAFVVGCHFVRELGETGAESEMKRWNQKNTPPLSENELKACYRSAIRTVRKSGRN